MTATAWPVAGDSVSPSVAPLSLRGWQGWGCTLLGDSGGPGGASACSGDGLGAGGMSWEDGKDVVAPRGGGLERASVTRGTVGSGGRVWELCSKVCAVQLGDTAGSGKGLGGFCASPAAGSRETPICS